MWWGSNRGLKRRKRLWLEATGKLTWSRAPCEIEWPQGRLLGLFGPSASYGSCDTGQHGALEGMVMDEPACKPRDVQRCATAPGDGLGVMLCHTVLERGEPCRCPGCDDQPYMMAVTGTTATESQQLHKKH